MSIFDDLAAKFYRKELRMEWSRKFIRAWLENSQLQFISHSVGSLTSIANSWIPYSTDPDHIYPTVSSEDIREAALEILNSEKIADPKCKKAIDKLGSIVQE